MEQNNNEKIQKKSSLGAALKSNKFRRSGMATLMSVVFIAIVIVLNVVVSALADRFPSMNLDLTAQKMNSLSDQSLAAAKGVKEDTAIYLIGKEDAYEKDQIYTSYGLKFSQVSNLAQKLQEANSKITVKFVDPDTNPEFISEYTESLTTGKVLVKTEKRYKILAVTDLFSMTQNQEGTGYDSYSMVDSALASALEMVNLDKVPVVTIATGHQELLNTENLAGFTSLMEGQNFEVKEVDFLTADVPENTQVLMIPTPTTDYTEEELAKLRTYLDDTTRKEPVTLLVTCYPTQGSLPKLTSFLEEWGVKAETGVVAETNSTRVAVSNPSYIIVDPSEELLQDNTYNKLVSPSSVPLTLLFDANNDITTHSLWTTNDSAYVVTEEMTQEDTENPETSKLTVASISTKLVQVDNSSVARNVIVFGSSQTFTDSFISTTAFGNRNYISDLLKYTTGTDGSAVSVMEQKVQTNVLDITASRGTIDMLGLGVFTIGLPVGILVAGLVIFLKRRHL